MGPLPTKQITCPLNRDYRRQTIKLMECVHIEMIEVCVGKKHDVDLGRVTNGQRGRGQTFEPERKSGQPDSNPRKKNGIREDHYPEIIE